MSANREKRKASARRKRRTIAEKEQPPWAEKWTPPEDVAALIEDSDSLLGQSSDRSDIGWGGGADDIDEGSTLAEVVRIRALKEILLAIIDHREVDDRRSSARKNLKPHREFRLEKVLEALVGIQAPRGPTPAKLEQVASRAAPAYYSQVFGLAPQRSERDIFIEAMWPEGPPPDLTSKDLDNAIKDAKKYFHRPQNKHRLMIEHALADSREVEFGRDCTRDIMAALADLGLVGRTAR